MSDDVDPVELAVAIAIRDARRLSDSRPWDPNMVQQMFLLEARAAIEAYKRANRIQESYWKAMMSELKGVTK